MLDKKSVRQYFKEKRKQLAYQEVVLNSDRIKAQLINYFDFKNKVVHVFLPIKKFNEVNLLPFIDYLHQNNVVVITSITDSMNEQLSHVVIRKDTVFEEDSWGIPTPINAEIANLNQIDFVIVPLLAFDRKGHRVGYGKGYYDRFLECLDAIKIGVSHFEVLEDELETNEYDIALDRIITPTKIHSSNAKK